MALQDDFKKYFEQVQPGQVVEVPGGGTVTRNADGTATFSNGQYNYQYDANTSTDQVAANVPALAAQWAKTYGTPAPAAPFQSLEEYKQWEAQNVHSGPAQTAAGYEVPDYLRQMGLAHGGGDETAFKRFLFFKNNPQYAEDYAGIHNGQLSRFATDSSTLRRTNMNSLTPQAQALYEKEPGALALAEGFNFDPNMYAARRGGTLAADTRTTPSSYLQRNAMDAKGNITASDNFAKASEWARNNPNYNVNAYDLETGGLMDGGNIYNSVTGQPIFATNNQDRLQAEALAAQGRKGDTEVAHVTPGEVVIPRELKTINPKLYAELMAQVARIGGDPSKMVVGNGSVNPRTGLQEFATQDEVRSAYESVLGRSAGADEVSWWANNAGDNFMDAFKAAAQPELSSKSTYSGQTGGVTPMPGASTGGITPKSYESSSGTTGGVTPMPSSDYSGWQTGGITPKAYGGESGGGSGGGGSGSGGGNFSNAFNSDQISNIYRNVFGRDAEQAGVDFWSNYAKTNGNEQAYNAMVAAGKDVGEITNNLSYQDALKQYQGPMGGASGTSIVDEWFWNALGRAPTAAERDQYKTGSQAEANSSFDTFENWARTQQGFKNLDIFQASQLYGKKTIKPGVDENGRPTTGIGLDQIKDPAMWDIDADQTVAGQLSKILANDSPLMQQARARALQQMNGRGLANSSMAQTAADSAMYDQAMQIAQQDAGTYADRGKYNTDSKNTFGRDNNAFVRDAFMADFNLAANDWMAERNFDREFKMLDKSQQLELDRMAVSNGYQSARDQYLNQWQKEAASQSNDWQKTILDIQQKHSKELEEIRQKYSSNQTGTETDNAEKAQAKADLQNALSKFASDAFKLDTSSMEPDVADQAYNNLAQSYNAIIKIATQKLGWKFEDWDIDLRTKPAPDEGGSGGGGSGGGGNSSSGGGGAGMDPASGP